MNDLLFLEGIDGIDGDFAAYDLDGDQGRTYSGDLGDVECILKNGKVLIDRYTGSGGVSIKDTDNEIIQTIVYKKNNDNNAKIVCLDNYSFGIFTGNGLEIWRADYFTNFKKVKQIPIGVNG